MEHRSNTDGNIDHTHTDGNTYLRLMRRFGQICSAHASNISAKNLKYTSHGWKDIFQVGSTLRYDSHGRRWFSMRSTRNVLNLCHTLTLCVACKRYNCEMCVSQT